ncbi:MAG: Aqualysin-1 [Gemmatimonadaceae bacterium]|nr:Aqualysin-1 [Gemmatimonadaceae bacterium]
MYRKVLAVSAVVVLAACQDSPSPIEPTEPKGDLSVDQAQVVEELPQVPENAVEGQVVPDQYVVVLKNTVSDVTVNARRLAREHGARLGYVYGAALKGFSARMPAAVAARLARDPMVEYIEPDRVVTTQTTQFGAPWGLDRIDQVNLPLNGLFNYLRSGTGVRIYIIDTGMRISHQQFRNLAGASRAAYSWDFVDNDPVAQDCNGHGTHVAGTAAGRTYGVAKNAYLRAVRVLNCAGSGTFSQVIAGVNWVTANAIKPAVANMSLGGGLYAPLNLAVMNSIASGVTYAVAAGNSSGNACSYSPSSVGTALSVMASASNDTRAGFSNFGACADLYAPGVSIVSAWWTSDVATAVLNGTSMASPHVAGVAAQYLQTTPLGTPAMVTAQILGMASIGKIIGNPAGTPNRLLRTWL